MSEDKRKFGQLKNIANIGDIVVVAGYFGKEFLVDSYTHEIDYQPTYTEEVILYDVSDIITGEYMLAYQEDVSVIRRAGDAETKPKPPNASSLDMDFGWTNFPDLGAGWEWIGEMKFDETEDKPMRKSERYNREIVDDLIDEWIDKKSLIELDGRDEGGEYAEQLAKIEGRIRNITEGKR